MYDDDDDDDDDNNMYIVYLAVWRGVESERAKATS